MKKAMAVTMGGALLMSCNDSTHADLLNKLNESHSIDSIRDCKSVHAIESINGASAVASIDLEHGSNSVKFVDSDKVATLIFSREDMEKYNASMASQYVNQIGEEEYKKLFGSLPPKGKLPPSDMELLLESRQQVVSMSGL
jgi:hypothetical protein